MSGAFDDIDTPVSEAELGAIAEPSPEEVAALEQLAGEETTQETEPVADAGGEKVAAEPAAETPAAPAEEHEDKRSPVIPRARFDEVHGKLQAERAENERLKAELDAARNSKGQPPAADAGQDQGAAFDLKAQQKAAADALLEGDMDRYAEIQGEIYQHIAEQAAAKAVATTTAKTTRDAEMSALSAVATKAVQQYPFLDPNSGNEQAVADVVEWRDFYIAKGEKPSLALEKAVAKVGPMYSNTPAAEPLAPATDPRKAAAIARNAADAAAQPAAPVAGVGNRAVPPTPKIDTQEDWERLPEKERERLLMGA